MAQQIRIKSTFFENLTKCDMYTLAPITDPVVLGCGNVKERMEKIWKELLEKRQGNLTGRR